MITQHISQPHPSSICGQIAVAVLADKSLEEICAIVGHRKPTKTRDLVAAFKKLEIGYAGNRCIPTRNFFDAKQGAFLAQVRGTWVTDIKSNWHWVAVNDGLVYDGQEEKPLPLELYQHSPGRRITSFLPVNIKESHGRA